MSPLRISSKQCQRAIQSMNEAAELIPTRQSLLSRLKDWSDNESWRTFFETYWRLIYNTALKAGLNDAEASDVVQETMISVFKAMYEVKRRILRNLSSRLRENANAIRPSIQCDSSKALINNK